MAKVQIVAKISGSRDGVDWPNPGETIDVPAEEAADLIRLGFAKEITREAKSPVVEKAVAPKGETRGGLTKASTGL